MFDVEMYLQKLRAMDPSDVAAMVKNALEDANVEYSAEETGILFDGLFTLEQVSIFCSTTFVVSPSALAVKGVCISNDFDASDYALAA